jgi:hypothetical protein
MAEERESNKYFDGDKPSLTVRPELSGVKEKSIGTLKVDVDCSDALRGLKAVTREAKKAAAALKELEEQQSKMTGWSSNKSCITRTPNMNGRGTV